MGGTQFMSGHPNVSFTFCIFSQSIMGWKYFISELASSLLVPMASWRTSGQGLEEPAWRIFLEMIEVICVTSSLFPENVIHALCSVGDQVRWLTLKWLLLLLSGRCHMCARGQCDWLLHTICHEAGTAGWSWRNTCGRKNGGHLFSICIPRNGAKKT